VICMMFPGDAMNQKCIMLYGRGEYPRREPGFYQFVIESLEDMNSDIDHRDLKPLEHR
jgi:hypothetical protein